MIQFQELSEAYRHDLQAYLAGPGEEGLAAAYEHGRHALSMGIGLVGFAEMHWRAFSEIEPGRIDGPFTTNLSASFFAEAMAPYEMALRGYRDANIVLKRANEQLERANLMKTRFFNYINHELRTPLNSVLGFAELLTLPKHGELTQVQSRYNGNIIAAGRHMLHLVNEMLDLAKLEAGKMEVARERVDLGDVIAKAVEQSSALALNSGVELEYPPRDDLFAEGDPQRLLQVFLNLLSNALKFTPRGGRITVHCANGGQQLEITVTDTGAGIPEDQLEVIFDEFAQAALTETPTSAGTGLGLPLSRRLMEAMGGTVTVRSIEGRGSTFIVSVPKSEAEAGGGASYADGLA